MFGTFSEGIPLNQKCKHCEATFDRELSWGKLALLAEANRKQHDILLLDDDEQHEAIWKQVNNLTKLESFVQEGAPNGLPPLHLEVLCLLGNLATLHHTLASRFKCST